MAFIDCNELRAAYRKVGVERGRTVYVTGNFGKLGRVFSNGNPLLREAVLQVHAEILLELLGPEGTLAFPAHSWGLVRSDIVFDPATTPADYAFSEYLRSKFPVSRQVHPYASIAAIGANRSEIVDNQIRRHPYGPETPFDRLAQADALHVSVGLPARLTISAVHHCEFLAGVPYRYTKAFYQNCHIGGEDKTLEFFLYVLYLEAGVVRDKNVAITSLPEIASTLRGANIGRNGIESLPLAPFVSCATRAMQSDPYLWLRQIPETQPWTQ